jgi:hypothetical protein
MLAKIAKKFYNTYPTTFFPFIISSFKDMLNTTTIPYWDRHVIR